MRKTIRVVEPDELDDAYRLIADLGYRSNDFDITQHADPSPPRPALITGTVTITRKRNSQTKSYVAGDRSTWVTELKNDLKANAFGPPVSSARVK